MSISAKTRRLRARPLRKRPEGYWEAYRAGKQAGWARREDCPHEPHTPLSVGWWEGYENALEEEREERIAKMG